MANYASLKAAIQAVIKQNGNNEITGDLLQEALLSMINLLGVGYQFVDIATPTTNPGTPDSRVFYIALCPGYYTNFDGITVDDVFTILTFTGEWNKIEIALPYNASNQFIHDAVIMGSDAGLVQSPSAIYGDGVAVGDGSGSFAIHSSESPSIVLSRTNWKSLMVRLGHYKYGSYIENFVIASNQNGSIIYVLTPTTLMRFTGISTYTTTQLDYTLNLSAGLVIGNDEDGIFIIDYSGERKSLIPKTTVDSENLSISFGMYLAANSYGAITIKFPVSKIFGKNENAGLYPYKKLGVGGVAGDDILTDICPDSFGVGFFAKNAAFKTLNGKVVVFGTRSGSVFDLYRYFIPYLDYRLSASLLSINPTGTSYPISLILAESENYIIYYNYSGAFRVDKRDDSFTKLKDAISTTWQYTFNYDLWYYSGGVVLCNVGGKPANESVAASTIISQSELDAWGADINETFHWAFGVVVNDITTIECVVVPHNFIGAGAVGKQERSGVNVRFNKVYGFVKPFIPCPVLLFGDSITSEWWISDLTKKLYAAMIAENIGFDITQENWSINTTGAGKSKLLDANGNVCVIRQGYPNGGFATTTPNNLLSHLADAIAESPKIMVIAAGTNDFGYSSVLGDVDSSDTTTACGGMNSMIQQIKTALPMCQIFISLPLPRETQNEANTQGLILKDYVDKFRLIAQKYSLPVVDLFNNSNIYWANEGGIYLRTDGIHPNPDGYKIMCRLIANRIIECN